MRLRSVQDKPSKVRVRNRCRLQVELLEERNAPNALLALLDWYSAGAPGSGGVGLPYPTETEPSSLVRQGRASPGGTTTDLLKVVGKPTRPVFGPQLISPGSSNGVKTTAKDEAKVRSAGWADVQSPEALALPGPSIAAPSSTSGSQPSRTFGSGTTSGHGSFVARKPDGPEEVPKPKTVSKAEHSGHSPLTKSSRLPFAEAAKGLKNKAVIKPHPTSTPILRSFGDDDVIPPIGEGIAHAYHFSGPSLRFTISLGNLLLPEDIPNDRTFRWFSFDPALGNVDTGPIPASTWNFFEPTLLGPARLVFSGTVLPHGAPATTVRGQVVFGPVNRATVEVVRGTTRVLYTLQLLVCLDLNIHKPPVLDPTETRLTPAEEFARGAQTWVNLDNDDRDAAFDFVDNPVRDEDEMIRLTVRMAGTGIAGGVARLVPQINGEFDPSIRIWQTRDKQAGTEYVLGTPLTGFTVDGGVLSKDLWVEGIRPHSLQRQTRLVLRHTASEFVNDAVAITVLGVQSLDWLGRGNGFTPDSMNHDSDTLDRLPTPAGIDTFRVFPDARTPLFNLPRHFVDIRVQLTVAPVEPVNLFLRAFDLDDPSDELAFIDPNDTGVGGNYSGTAIPYTADEDNRGTVGGLKAGLFTGQDAHGIAQLIFPTGVTSRTIEFQVSQHPGDNYRVVANGDRDFLLTLRNRDQDDQFRIVDPAVAGGAADREVRLAANYASLPLTVWRLLHVEIDSMGPVVGNAVFGNVTGFASAVGPPISTAVTTLTVDVNLDDGSRNRGSIPPANGRFENGKVELVPSNGGVFGVAGNSNTVLFLSAAPTNILAVPLPFFAIDNDVFGGNDHFSGDVSLISFAGTGWDLTLIVTSSSSTPIDWPDFVGGRIRIGAGPDMPIIAVNPAASTVQIPPLDLRIPFMLRDDDSAVMPTMPDVSHMPVAFADAYVLPVVDGAGNPAFNRDNVGFSTHVIHSQATRDADLAAALALPGAMESLGNRTNVYWGAYVLAAYQSSSGPIDFGIPGNPDLRSDNDPDGESALGGVASLLGRGVLVFIEELVDQDSEFVGHVVAPTLPRVVTHEVGHLFGLPDRGLGGGVMGPDLHNNADVRFIPADINTIRSRVQSP